MLEIRKESQEKASQGAKGRGHIRKEGVGNYEECSQGTEGPGEVGMEECAPAALLVMEAGDELLGTMRLETSGGRREACGGVEMDTARVGGRHSRSCQETKGWGSSWRGHGSAWKGFGK